MAILYVDTKIEIYSGIKGKAWTSNFQESSSKNVFRKLNNPTQSTFQANFETGNESLEKVLWDLRPSSESKLLGETVGLFRESQKTIQREIVPSTLLDWLTMIYTVQLL